MRKIHTFLKSKSSEAFTRDEILTNVIQDQDASNVIDWKLIFLVLFELRAIDARQVRGLTHYAYVDDLPELH